MNAVLLILLAPFRKILEDEALVTTLVGTFVIALVTQVGALGPYQNELVFLLMGIFAVLAGRDAIGDVLMRWASAMLTAHHTTVAQYAAEGIDSIEDVLNIDIPDDLEITIRDLVDKGAEQLGYYLARRGTQLMLVKKTGPTPKLE